MPGCRQPPTSRPSKYRPLAAYLATQSSNTVRLSFPEMEAILSFAMPDMAYVDGGWWRSDTRSWVHALREAGWEAHLHILERVVVFTRIRRQVE